MKPNLTREEKDAWRKVRREKWVISQSGYGGLLPNGEVVDRREYPQAVPIPWGPIFSMPENEPYNQSVSY